MATKKKRAPNVRAAKAGDWHLTTEGHEFWIWSPDGYLWAVCDFRERAEAIVRALKALGETP